MRFQFTGILNIFSGPVFSWEDGIHWTSSCARLWVGSHHCSFNHQKKPPCSGNHCHPHSLDKTNGAQSEVELLMGSLGAQGLSCHQVFSTCCKWVKVDGTSMVLGFQLSLYYFYRWYLCPCSLSPIEISVCTMYNMHIWIHDLTNF